MAADADLSGSVPLIDFTTLADGSVSEQAVREIAQACRDWGFFQIVNHGVSERLIENVWRHTRQFFDLPAGDKMSILRSRDNPWGFYNNELTKNRRDKKEVFDFTRPGVDPIYAAANRWPAGQHTLQAVMLEYYDACSELSMQLLQTFFRGLGLSPDFMHKEFAKKHTGFIRLNYYPLEDPLKDAARQPESSVGLGVHHHTDAGAFTVLLQDEVGGLQVHRDGLWYDVEPIAGSLVINTGDMMQVWSNDRYRAALHRVQAMETSKRYSIPFFFNPPAEAQIAPLPSMVTEDRPCRYRCIDWAEFRGKRSEGDYADYGTEVQIAHYRL